MNITHVIENTLQAVIDAVHVVQSTTLELGLSPTCQKYLQYELETKCDLISTAAQTAVTKYEFYKEQGAFVYNKNSP